MGKRTSDDRLRMGATDLTEHEALVRRFRAPLVRYFERRVGVREDAEELAQETFIRLFRNVALHEIRYIEGFVFITAANLLTDFYRKADRRRRIEGASLEGVDAPNAADNPQRILEGRAELNVLLNAVKDLPPKCRAVFVLHRFEGVAHSEIARRLGISVSMVEKHIAAALIRLRKRLEGADND